MNDYIRKKNVLILVEGFEEKPYIDRILSFPNINKDVYHFSEPVNVKGNGRIAARYQYEVQTGFHDIVLVFCDADKGSDQFLSIVNEIGEEFFLNKEDGIKVFIFSNPVALEIVLSHFGEVHLTKVAKKDNVKVVEELTGIKDYNASKDQINEMINKIHYKSLSFLKENLAKISTNYKDIPSTNFLIFLSRFESDDTSWIDEINKLKK